MSAVKEGDLWMYVPANKPRETSEIPSNAELYLVTRKRPGLVTLLELATGAEDDYYTIREERFGYGWQRVRAR